MTRPRIHIPIAAGVLMLLLLMGYAAGPSSGPNPANDLAGKVQSRLEPMVATLYLNSKALTEVYRDLRSMARGHALRGNDSQLNYVQKTNLYVHKALFSATRQWEQLALMEDIRPAALADYFTLRHKGLGQALNEAVYDERFITIYRTGISHAEVSGMIDRALVLMADNRRIFSQMMAAMDPLVRKGRQPKVL